MSPIITDPADFKQMLESEVDEAKSKLSAIISNPKFSSEYKEASEVTWTAHIAKLKKEIAGFDNLTHPVIY